MAVPEKNHLSGGEGGDVPEDLAECVAFHGHLCPGLVYGYLVAKEAIRRLEIHRSTDEEVVAVPENDSCAVDALQVLLGTTAGKGNLVVKNYGKNAFTVVKRGKGRNKGRSFRFARKTAYEYGRADRAAFRELDEKITAGTATREERARHRLCKCRDLLEKGFDGVFTAAEVPAVEPPYAPLAPSVPCSRCGEMTMATRLTEAADGKRYCISCAHNDGIGASS